MAVYTLNLRSDGDGYDIGVIADNGARHTILGFKTKHEAESWIATDRAASRTLIGASDGWPRL